MQPAQPSPAARTHVVLDHADVARAVRRIAHEITEHTRGSRDVVLLGIPTRGVYLARRLADAISAIEGDAGDSQKLEGQKLDGQRGIPVGALDITLYRDDLRMRPARALEPTSIPETGIDDKTVVLVDDVLFSGRTVRAALDALNDLGRPAVVQLAALVDRGHRQLPIRPDYVGKNLPTSLTEQVRVELAEIDGVDRVTILGEAS